MSVAVSMSRVRMEARSRPDRPVLDSVTFAVLGGEFAAVVVSSPSARLALRAVLDRSERPTAGTVFIAASSIAVLESSTPERLPAAPLDAHPQLVIADDPTGGLDGHAARRVMEHLHALDDGCRTIVLLTHDGDLARRHARRVILISDGRVVRDADATLCPPGG
jgi:ABC-type ATPase involved in cell division